MKLNKSQFGDLADCIAAARGYLSTPAKWCKGESMRYNFNVDGYQYCIVGALRETTYGSSMKYDAAYMAFCAANPEIEGHIPRWNDSPERKHNEVLAAFDKAIAYCQVRAEADAPEYCEVAETAHRIPGSSKMSHQQMMYMSNPAPMMQPPKWVPQYEPIAQSFGFYEAQQAAMQKRIFKQPHYL